MKKLILILLFSVNSAYAGISLDLKQVGVVELVESVVRTSLGRDYVISPDVLASPSKLSMSVKNIPPEKLLGVLSDVLAGAGLALNDRSGILYLERSKPEPVQQTQPAVNSLPPGYPQIGHYPFQQQQNQLTYYQNGNVPKAVRLHKPRGKSLEFLVTVAKLAGAYVPEGKGKADVLVYAGDEETVERAAKLLEEVDTAADSLQVRAVLLEYTEGDSASKSLSLALSALGGRVGFNYQAGAPVANALTFQGVNIQAALGFIDGDRRFKYLAEPSLRVADGEEARFVVGQDVPVRAAAVKDEGGNPVQSVEYKTAGVVISVLPKVMRESIRVVIGQQVSSFALTTTSNIDSPTILKRQSETVVDVSDGELIVLAGMDEKTENQSRSGGWSFPAMLWGSERNNSRSQLLLMLEVKKVKPPASEI